MIDPTAPRCDPRAPRLSDEVILEQLALVPGWMLVEDGTALSRTLSFANYWETMAFVNAVAWIAHGEDHHPDLSVHVNRCVVRYQTHTVRGLTQNDFVCAARVNGLLLRPR